LAVLLLCNTLRVLAGRRRRVALASRRREADVRQIVLVQGLHMIVIGREDDRVAGLDRRLGSLSVRQSDSAAG
jgi:hypothetical protein